MFKYSRLAILTHSHTAFCWDTQVGQSWGGERPDHREHQGEYLARDTSPRNSLWAWTASTDACKTSSTTLPISLSLSFENWAKPWYNLSNRGSKDRSRFNVYTNLMYIQHATQNRHSISFLGNYTMPSTNKTMDRYKMYAIMWGFCY